MAPFPVPTEATNSSGGGGGWLRSAQDMDEERQRNVAYEYLCHLEEAKNW